MKENEKPKQVVELIEEDTPEYMNYHQLSAYLGVSTKTLQRWVRKRVIPAIKIGRKILFNLENVKKCVNKNTRGI